MKIKFQSTKIFDGFSTVFRQWRADGTHCQFLHGYGVSFKITFEGELDEKNWVWDFGGMKRAKGTIDGMNPKAWMDFMFDHKYIYDKVNEFVLKETNNRVRVTQVEFKEHNKNSAIYGE